MQYPLKAKLVSIRYPHVFSLDIKYFDIVNGQYNKYYLLFYSPDKSDIYKYKNKQVI